MRRRILIVNLVTVLVIALMSVGIVLASGLGSLLEIGMTGIGDSQLEIDMQLSLIHI